MDRRVFVTSLFAFAASLRSANAARARGKVFEPDLTKIVGGKGWELFNRQAVVAESAGRKAVRFDERAGVGLALLKDFQFKEGAIEFDVRGKNVLQKSFVGVAFHALDEATCDVVYFRPFNFK